MEGRNTLARYFDRAWLIYKGAETGLYADPVSRHKRGGPASWHGTVVGAVKWSKFLQDREELELRTLAGMVGRVSGPILANGAGDETAPISLPSWLCAFGSIVRRAGPSAENQRPPKSVGDRVGHLDGWQSEPLAV